MFPLLRDWLRNRPKLGKSAQFLLSFTQEGIWSALDSFESLMGRRDSLTPPRRLMNVGSGQFTRSDFHTIGLRLFQYLRDVGGLEPTDRVLDVGCGVGRIAIPLTQYLTPQATYDGIDIVKPSIEYCTQAISAPFPNFRFHHADMFNSMYNPQGQHQSHEYRFPFPESTFSFVFLTSVFTHMLSEGVENYLREIHRVMTPRGKCFITYFLLNESSESLMEAGRSHRIFSTSIPNGRALRPESPEEAVAFSESYVRASYAKYGLEIVEPIQYGSWCGRCSNVGYQDVVIATKV